MIIRSEEPADIDLITRVTAAAFADDPHGDHTEHHIVAALRRAGALPVSLVAEIDGAVAGHVAFSPVTIADRSGGWYGLGPVSVAPGRQRQGVGSALIRDGLSRLRASGAAGCVVVGDPDYYRRFGFVHDPALRFEGLPAEYFMALPFGTDRAVGAVHYHEAFGATGQD